MKKVLYTILFCSLCSQTWGQTWTTLTSPGGGHLFDIDFIDDNNGCVARQSGGEISYTTDGGATWNTSPDLAVDMYSIDMVDANSIFATGGNSNGNKTLNGGTSWGSKGSTGSGHSHGGIRMATPTIGWELSLSGNLYKTTNATTSWSFVTNVGALNTFTKGIALDANTAFFPTGTNRRIMRTIDGTNWIGIHTATANLICIDCINANECWAGLGDGTIIKTSNASAGSPTWTNHSTSSGNQINDIDFISATEGWTVGNSGTIQYTNDGGLTWSTQTSGTTLSLFGLSMISSTHGYASGFSGTLLEFTAPPPVISLDFDGTDDYVAINSIQDDLAGDATFTLEWWCKTTHSGTAAMIGSNTSAGGNFITWFISGGRFAIGPGINIPSTTIINDNTWHHLAFVQDGATQRIYVDGVLENSRTTAVVHAADATYSLGQEFDGGSISDLYNGKLDDVRIWNTARTTSEIATNRNTELTGTEAGLVAYYKFNTQDPNYAYDCTSNSNFGCFNGPTGTNNLPQYDAADAPVITAVVCGGGGEGFAEIDLIGNSISITDGDAIPSTTDDTDFGSVFTNSPDVHTFTIDNTVGTAALGVPSITVSGTHAADFTIGGITLPAAVPAGGTATFTLTFAPSAAGLHTATININNSDCDEAPYDFAVQGTGTLPPPICLNFDGSSDYVQTTSNLTITGAAARTFEFWAQSNGTAGRYFFSSGSSSSNRLFSLETGGGNSLTFHAYFNDINTGYIIDNCWHHYAVTYDGTNNLLIYVDGDLITTYAAGILNTVAAPLQIGAYVALNGRFNGNMDEFRVWDDVRTQAEIQANMDIELTGSEANLVEYYDFNQGTAIAGGNNAGLTTLFDQAAGDNNATLTNFALTGATSNWVSSPVPTTIKPEIDIQGGSPLTAIVDGNTVITTVDNTDFGTVATCGGKTKNYTYTIENTGTAVLNVTSINSSLGDFVINNLSQTLPATIAISGTMTFDITYTPSGLGTHNATISIDNDDFGECNYTFSVEGVGVSSTTDLLRDDALDFDGVNDNVDVPDNASLDIQFPITLEAWFNKSSNSGWDMIVDKRLASDAACNYGIGTNGGRPVFYFRNGAWTIHSSTTVVSLNEWHHMAAVYDGTTVLIYLDGVQVYTGAETQSLSFTNESLKIGTRQQGTQQHHGQIDEVTIWNTARTETEIRENMHLTLLGCESGLVAYYQMNDGTGSSTLTDKSGNGHTGTLTNMDPATDWIASGVNVGNDASNNSNSQTITTVPAGTSTQTFATANLEIRFFAHSGAENYTVTYQAFTPNTATGADGINIIQNPMWTVNKSTSSETQLVDYTFTFPAATFTSLDPTKYSLYWRSMNADGDWTKIATASMITATSATFGKISLTGQFMVVQESDNSVSDVRGNMYNFDNANGRIFIPNTTKTSAAALGLPTTTITVEAWVKPQATGTYADIVTFVQDNGSQEHGFELGYGGGLRARVAGGGAGLATTTGSPISLNEWHHTAFTYDGAIIRVYLDGVEVSTLAEAGAISYIDSWLVIGGYKDDNEDYLHRGPIDEVRIWSTVKTEAEIRENMHLTLKGNEIGLVSYYQFNNDDVPGTVNGVKDAMGLNDGMTDNMTTSDFLPSEVAVAGGTSDRITISSTGAVNFPNTDIDIEFGATHPNGEIVVYRLETEKPHGWNSITGDVDNEYFVVENFGANQTFSALNDITFNRLSYISPNDVGQPQATTPLQLYKRGDNDFGASWGTSLGGADNASAGSNGMVSFNTVNNLTSFSQIVLVNNGPNSDLPVELLNFDVERSDPDNVELIWSTASETNNQGFYIERMLEIEAEFEAIAFVDGQNTTLATSDYYEVDENSYTGVTYYRLKQVDFDGTKTYSKIKAVAGTANQNTNYIDVSIYPNPVYNELKVRFNELPNGSDFAKVKIMSANGQILHDFTAGIQSYQVLEIEYVKQLTPALYILSIEMDHAEKIIQKFIKQ